VLGIKEIKALLSRILEKIKKICRVMTGSFISGMRIQKSSVTDSNWDEAAA